MEIDIKLNKQKTAPFIGMYLSARDDIILDQLDLITNASQLKFQKYQTSTSVQLQRFLYIVSVNVYNHKINA